ncbi:hypothetical protein [Amphibacillus cookii]|uniref:hypothetical protein n=1 Tax=Amphibacillus cookii TaxID=767787 RepID=UPI00195E2126|nr:hypothetical protein [Amphibacillus cookii]MBM7541219.1 hypothetical protein [Amphibacillus cookii]
MEIHKLYEIVETFFSYKADMLYINTNENEVACMLYNSFLFKCNLDERYGTFGAGIVCGNQEANITEFLGETCSLNSDEQSVKESLKIVDNYCKLRLPDKFLEAFEEAYKE